MTKRREEKNSRKSSRKSQKKSTKSENSKNAEKNKAQEEFKKSLGEPEVLRGESSGKGKEGKRVQIQGGGLQVEDTRSVDNFENKTDDDVMHEREMNCEDKSERKDRETKSKHDPTSIRLQSVRRMSGQFGEGEDGRKSEREMEDDQLSSRYRKSVFSFIRENTEFVKFRELEKEEREEAITEENEGNQDGGEKGDHEKRYDATSARTRTTHMTQSTNISFKSGSSFIAQQDQSGKKGKMSDIQKLGSIIEDNNVAAAIKHIEVYAVKLLVNLDDN